MPTPEAFAREEIDRQLDACGWDVQTQEQLNIMAGLGVAVCEMNLKTGRADYTLYVAGKVIGTIEAKKEGFTLTGVEGQSGMYATGLPAGVPHYRFPIPFAYETDGNRLQFTNRLDPFPRSRELFSYHRPKELLELDRLAVQTEKEVNACSA